jgi:hypothetical protein
MSLPWSISRRSYAVNEFAGQSNEVTSSFPLNPLTCERVFSVDIRYIRNLRNLLYVIDSGIRQEMLPAVFVYIKHFRSTQSIHKCLSIHAHSQ